MEEIWKWATNTDLSQKFRIFWLAEVAGAEKTTVAHSIAQRCREQGMLVSSFFFDREVAGRNGPQRLFSTIARDLASFSGDVAEQIDYAIMCDSALPTAAVTRQFDGLILKPCQRLSSARPLVIVIDALDEGYDQSIDLLSILADKIPNLHRAIRFLVTSRPEEEFDIFLRERPHIVRRSMDIHEQPNKNDISVYIQ